MLDIKITKTTHPKEKPQDESKLGFGKQFSDHMFLMDYTAGEGWHDARIVPYGPWEMDPATTVFHYAQEIFEGMKAYRTADGKIQLFRPDCNANRFNDSADLSLIHICNPMKQRLADYVADFLAARGVTDVFSVVGGGAMHLNDALGHNPRLHVTYNHHEQACAIAAEAYARLENKIAAVCVTTGPGGTNALTGVVGGWLDSTPMFIVSGQVRYDTTARYALQYTGTPLRAMGDQEYDITKSVQYMTKFAAMLEDPKDIRYLLEKAWHLATTGRPGPVWLDIPVNFQGGYIETDELRGYDPAEDDAQLPPPVDDATIRTILEKIKNAKRPVFHAGYGIRLSGGYAAFRSVDVYKRQSLIC